MRVLIRADASTAIGTGHVMRCLTLADVLRARGAIVEFACRTLPGDLCEQIAGRGYVVHRLDSQSGLPHEAARQAASPADQLQDITQLRLITTGRFDWVVVDQYALAAVWEKAARGFAARICVIDDLANRPHDCDVLVDQNHFRDAAARYSDLVQRSTRLRVGARYALLRPEFAQWRAVRPPHEGAARKVLLCFGGSDSLNYTGVALQALSTRLATGTLSVDVVVGPSSPHVAALRTQYDGMPHVRIHSPAPDMAALLADADVAIGGGGGMSWERACLGVPTLAFSMAANQEQVLAAMIEDGLVCGNAQTRLPTEAEVSAWLDCLLGNVDLLSGLSRRSAALVDGLGAERVADEIILPILHFRSATMDDAGAIYAWRTAPEVQSASFQSPQFSLSSHFEWMRKTLADPTRILLIAERDGVSVGVVRLDIDPEAALISVYRAGAANGRDKLVQQATQWVRESRPDIRRISAEIMPENIASLRAFSDAGYKCNKHVYEIELRQP